MALLEFPLCCRIFPVSLYSSRYSSVVTCLLIIHLFFYLLSAYIVFVRKSRLRIDCNPSGMVSMCVFCVRRAFVCRSVTSVCLLRALECTQRLYVYVQFMMLSFTPHPSHTFFPGLVMPVPVCMCSYSCERDCVCLYIKLMHSWLLVACVFILICGLVRRSVNDVCRCVVLLLFGVLSYPCYPT